MYKKYIKYKKKYLMLKYGGWLSNGHTYASKRALDNKDITEHSTSKMGTLNSLGDFLQLSKLAKHIQDKFEDKLKKEIKLTYENKILSKKNKFNQFIKQIEECIERNENINSPSIISITIDGGEVKNEDKESINKLIETLSLTNYLFKENSIIIERIK